VDVSWPAATDDTGVTSYVVYQDGKRIGVTDATTLRVSGLTADTEYSFTVVARDEALNASDPSKAAVVTTPADHDLALNKPVTASSSYSEDYAPEKAVDGISPPAGRRARACPTRPGSRSTWARTPTSPAW
jgi:chitodextrinase